jgi:hypothetical protein
MDTSAHKERGPQHDSGTDLLERLLVTRRLLTCQKRVHVALVYQRGAGVDERRDRRHGIGRKVLL